MEHTDLFKLDGHWIGIAVSPKGVSQVILPARSKREAQRRLAKLRTTVSASLSDARAKRLLATARREIAEYFAGRRKTFTIRMDLAAGSPFQRRVWRVASRIPYGRVRTYQWVARRVGGKQYARAVGTALGANCVPLVIPCHRVIAHDGSLGGFTGGLPLKRRLLALEGVKLAS